MTTISAIIPTAAADLDRLALLRRSVLSALHQLREGDEILVAADTTDSPLGDARKLCEALQPMANRFDPQLGYAVPVPVGPRVRFVPHTPGHHDFGHAQINHAMSKARGEWLCFNDDDDVFAAGAFGAIREYAGALTAKAPMLFRFRSYHGPTFWLAPGLLGQGLIGGHCAVVPNLPSLLGEWSPRYEGDWDFIESTLRLWAAVGVGPVWVDRLISIARPA